jgi:arylsulfatase A-like enzyme
MAFSTFIADLSERGMLDKTLVVVMSEFGRTPNINLYYGRDHWSKAWSIVMAGGKVASGAVFGKTNEDGTEVIDGQVDHGQIFHTYLRAAGIDSSQSLLVDGREVPMADPAAEPIWKILT